MVCLEMKVPLESPVLLETRVPTDEMVSPETKDLQVPPVRSL